LLNSQWAIKVQTPSLSYTAPLPTQRGLITRDYQLLHNDVISMRTFLFTQIVFKWPFLTFNFRAEIVGMARISFSRNLEPRTVVQPW